MEQEKKYLVPCRWKKSGWKYIQVEQKKHNDFFNSPNRRNMHGDELTSETVVNPKHSQRRAASLTTYGEYFTEDKKEHKVPQIRNKFSIDSSIEHGSGMI